MACGPLTKVMLSAFTAKPLVELKSRDKSKIEAILAYGGLNLSSKTSFLTTAT